MPIVKTGIAFIGCGFVADYYAATIDKYTDIELIGVYDKDRERLKKFTDYYDLNAFDSLQDLLDDKSIKVVLNLTDPRSHYKISLQCLEFNKHVYSEKPLAMSYEEAKGLVMTAKQKGLLVSCAPCSVLGKAAKTLAYAMENKICGDVKLVYAELDDGMVHRMAYKSWYSESGAPWPYRDEFETGCTLEHSGYYLSWLIRMFGAVESVTAYSDCLIKDKVPSEPELQPNDTADFSVGILRFESGIVARLTTTIVARHDHTIRIFGDNGVVSLRECWDNNEKVYFNKMIRIRRKTFISPVSRRVKTPYMIKVNKLSRGNTKMDFMLGVSDLVDAINGGTDQMLTPQFSLHVNEVALALQCAGKDSSTYFTKSRF
ncbi:MAG: Gfo/Idh/MocA family oxidoreductase [Candidatus Sedimenticola sp. (ex Thyasira tokunagai)]